MATGRDGGDRRPGAGVPHGEVVPNALVGGELDVLAAAVLGGASLNGGKGSVVGTLMGVFLIGVLKTVST